MTQRIFDDCRRDNERSKLFVKESSKHQAKLNVKLFRYLVEMYTSPGDLIIDPMSGIGTVHLAATMGRDTLAVEIVPEFASLQFANCDKLDEVLGLDSRTKVLQGDCRRFLPTEAYNYREPGQSAAVIFSPPYGSMWKSTGSKSRMQVEKHMEVGYDNQDANVGNITIFPQYLEAMRTIYLKCWESLLPGEVLISVCKDYMQSGERMRVSQANLRILMECGFNYEDWHLRNCDAMLFKQVHMKRKVEENVRRAGLGQPPLVDNKEHEILVEDILVMRR